MSLWDLGWDPFFEAQIADEERSRWAPARVVWEGRGAYRLSTGSAEWTAALAGRLRHRAASRAELPTVGDWVLATARTIHRVLARRSAFSRGAAGRRSAEQVVAANVDTVLIVTSPNREFSLRRLERYLALAWESGAAPAVVLNKADLEPDPAPWIGEARGAAGGVPVIATSAVRGDGLPELAALVREGGTTALLGSSGVGKSALINALVGEDRQRLGDIRTSDDRGRHSTTARQLFRVPGGGVVIDTPGMRELQVWDAEAGLEQAFGDVERLAADCRFRDCSHDAEPGCAVIAAVDAGALDAARLEAYRRLTREELYVRTRLEGGPDRARRAKLLSKAMKQSYRLRRR